MPLQDDLILPSYTSAVGPLSAVERQRRYRERTNANEARRALSLAKGRQRWRERVESGKVKSINSMSEKEKRCRRKKWAGAKKRYVHIILLPRQMAVEIFNLKKIYIKFSDDSWP